MVVTEPTRGIDGTRARPLRDPDGIRRILDDRARYAPVFADIFTAEDDATRARQLDWQDRADPGRSGEYSVEWRAVRAEAAELLVSRSERLAREAARGVLVRIRRQPRVIDRDIVGPAISEAVRATLAPEAAVTEPAFALGLTPAADAREERVGSDAACAMSRSADAADDAARLAIEAAADTVAFLANALPSLTRSRLASHETLATLVDELTREHHPRAGTIRLVRPDAERAAAEPSAEVWLDLRAANSQSRGDGHIFDRWDPLVSAGIDLSLRCLHEMASLVAEHGIELVGLDPGEERSTFFWHELRGATIAQR